MPSSPEPLPAAGWQLPDLRVQPPSAAPIAAPAARFTASAPTVEQAPPVFEVSSAGGVPDGLLAEARSAAQAVGYAAGWTSGIRAARVVTEAEAHAARAARETDAYERRLQLRRSFRALDTAAGRLEQRAVPAAEELEELIVSAALDLAEALVGQVLHDDAARSTAALRRALSLAPSAEPVCVAVSPADYSALTADGAEPAEALGMSRQVQLVVDAALAPGDAQASCGATVVDARLSAGLERVREVLGVLGVQP